LTHVLSDSHSVHSICLSQYCDQAKWFLPHVAILPCGVKLNLNGKTDRQTNIPNYPTFTIFIPYVFNTNISLSFLILFWVLATE